MDDTPTDAMMQSLFLTHFQPGAINVHVVGNYAANGMANPPQFYPLPNRIYSTVIRANRLISSTFAHEIGHCLGLLHTHSTRGVFSNENASDCFQEPVSRSMIQPNWPCLNFSGSLKCEVNGDGLCDTPGDPDLIDKHRDITNLGSIQIPNWRYTGNALDNWGVAWSPDVCNIMSYSRPEIRERFSPSQVGIMYSWIEAKNDLISFGFRSSYPYLNYDGTKIDVYEPDNNRSPGNPQVFFGSIQHRGFHRIPIGKRNDVTGYSIDSEDWVRITVPHNGYITNILTSQAPNSTVIDTKITLFANDGVTVLATNDNISFGNFYSEIKNFTLNQGEYWLRIQNMSNAEGEYLLHLERCGTECCFNDLLSNVHTIDQNTGNLLISARVSGTAEEYFGFTANVNQATFGANIPGATAFGAGPTASPNSQLRLSICNQSELTFESGTLEIGDPTNGRTAEVRFTEGTKLDVDGSSQIIVKNGSKLIIEAGAELNMAAGAQVILAGSNAVLEIAGTLRLGNNQYFSPATQAGQSRGYIRLLPGAQIVTGLGAQIALGEVNNFRKVLELAPNAQIALPATLAQFSINHGEVQMAAGSRLLVHTKAVFIHARFERLGTTGLHQGVLLTGNYPHQIMASRFNHASTGLELNLTNNLHRPQLLTNQFNNNERGLVVQGGGLLIGNGSFTGNTQRALTLNAVAASVQINNVQFTNNTHGIFIHSANSHPISINSCLLQRSNIGGTAVEVWQGNVSMRSNTVQNHQTGLIAYGNDSRVRLACNQFNNNQIALDPGYWGLVDLSNQARNVIANANIAIYPDLGHVLLDQGFNDFSNANTYVLIGDLAPNCFTYTTLSKPGIDYGFYELPAENNKFESIFLQPNISNIPISNNLVTTYVPNHSCDGIVMWLDENDPRPIFRKATNHNIAFLSCNQAAPPWWHDVFNTADLGGDPTQWLVYSPLYPGIELKQAIVTALNDITTDLENPQNDSMALERLKQLLTATYTNIDETGQALLATANAAMNYALINAYTLGILPVNYGINPEPLDDKVYTLLASFDDLIANTDDQHLKVKYALDKVLLYRLAGHYETAIAELQNSLANQHQNFGYWDCFLQLEWSYFQGHIGADQFAQEAQQCMSMFQARRRRRQPPSMPNYHSTVSNALAVSPNPSNSSSTVSFTRTESPAWLQLTDAQGKLVYRLPIEVGNTQVNLNAQQLPMGVYLIELHEPAKTVLRAKWVVSK